MTGQTVAVDVTPLLPDGANGGAKPLSLALIEALGRLGGDMRFVLLTSQACHDELARLEKMNIERLLVDDYSVSVVDLLGGAVRDLLMFCPFSLPRFLHPQVPIVSLVHDLQHIDYPQFFDPQEFSVRDLGFKRTARTSSLIVTVSEFSRKSVIDKLGVSEERAVTICPGLVKTLAGVPVRQRKSTLARFGLQQQRFLLYPANFWPHKNHRMLLLGFRRFLDANPDSTMKLVLTGAAHPDPSAVKDAALGMGLGRAVVFAGYVSDQELSVLMHDCFSLVFPSLYEGFGMPVLEAMSCGRPVLCSDATCLPETAGDAAVFFDPRIPDSISAAITAIYTNMDLVSQLIERGHRRIETLGNIDRIALRYLDVFREVLSLNVVRDGVVGIYADRWSRPVFGIGFSASAASRRLEIVFDRNCFPSDDSTVLHAKPSNGESFSFSISLREKLTLRCKLPTNGGFIEFTTSRCFVPADFGQPSDRRQLGVRVESCRISPLADAGEESDRGADLLIDIGC